LLITVEGFMEAGITIPQLVRTNVIGVAVNGPIAKEELWYLLVKHKGLWQIRTQT
jgi:hypothetical protein